MDIYSTKGTPQKFIAARLKSLGPPSTTASVLRECASTFANSRKAWASEAQALKYFLDKDHSLLYHRQKLFGVEIDLILHDRDGVIQFIEVKAYTSDLMMPYRLTRKQTSRLIYAKTYFENVFRMPTQILLAAVKSQEVEIYLIG